MPLQFIIFLVTILGMVAAIMVGMTVSESMGFEEYVRLGAVFSPLFLVFVLALRKNWLPIAIGIIPLNIALPVIFLRSFGLPVIYGGMIFAIVLGAYCFKQFQKPIINSLGSWCIIFTAIIVIARVIYDRPGSALLGGTGGGSAAVTFAAAFCVFWAFSKIGAEPNWTTQSAIKWMFLILLFAFSHRMITDGILGNINRGSAETDLQQGIFYNLYARPAWLLFSLAFALIIYRFRKPHFRMWLNISIVAFSLGLLSLSLLTGHRRTILFAMSTVLAVTIIYRMHKKAAISLGVACLVGTIIIAGMGSDVLTPHMRRSLSLIIPVSQSDAYAMREEVGNTEYGWKSDFRNQLYALAWERIRTNPVFGDGFAFSAEDLMKTFYFGQKGMDVRVVRMVQVGGVHNSALHLTMAAGLPAGILFMVGSTAIFIQFCLMGYRTQNPQHRMFIAAIAGMYGPLFGHMFLNGGHIDFFRVLLLLGVMNGILCNQEFRKGLLSANAEANSLDQNGVQELEEQNLPAPAMSRHSATG
jgi:hypothetical protein